MNLTQAMQDALTTLLDDPDDPLEVRIALEVLILATAQSADKMDVLHEFDGAIRYVGMDGKVDRNAPDTRPPAPNDFEPGEHPARYGAS